MAVTLHVALDPRDPAPADVAIVVDCIRATTTISHALDTGYASVTCVGEIDDAHAERAEGVLLGGERHGVMIEGFDLGNSPAEYAVQRGERIVLTTTNGTRAILQAVAESTTVLVGALVNAQALVDAALAAVGIERFRRVNARFPESLDELNAFVGMTLGADRGHHLDAVIVQVLDQIFFRCLRK